MTAAQLYAMAKLLFEFEIPGERKLNFTQYTSGRCRVRFMNENGDIVNYMFELDGTYSYDPPEGNEVS